MKRALILSGGGARGAFQIGVWQYLQDKGWDPDIICGTSQLTLLNNSVNDIDHVMASSAMPILFPWRHIDGEPYWDGGVMANTPLFPALESRTKEIIFVLLSKQAYRLIDEG